MQQLLCPPRDFKIIGRLLCYENPALANTLYTNYQSNQKIAREKDLKKIEPFFIQFCVEESINPSEHRGAQYKRAKVDKQRLFIAVMINLYAPHFFDTVNKKIKEPNSLAKTLSLTLCQDKGNLSRMMREVITTYPVYDEFRGQAERLVTALIKA